MRKNVIYIVVLVIIAAAIAFYALSGGSSKPQSAALPVITVEMTSAGFSPAEATVHPGDTVAFVNASSGDYFWPASDLHPTHELYPEFDPRQPVDPGASWTFAFERTGSWHYHDHLHPNRRGIINVVK